MSLRTGQTKWSGSAASYLAYAEEESIGSDEIHLKYHDRPSEGIVFTHVRGKATEHLPGLNLEVGLTKEQHKDLHEGRWSGIKPLQRGCQKQWEVDTKGKFVHLVDPVTGEYVLDDQGRKQRIPKIDPETGKQEIKLVHTAGYDISFAVSKDIDEYLIAHPEDIALVQECLLAAVDKAMTVAVEEHCRLVRPVAKAHAVRVNGGTKQQGSTTERVTADGLIWWTTFGSAARPTPESISRGYGADPHLHVHCFLSSMAWHEGRWRTVDGASLMRTADYRRDVAEVELARLLEEAGIEIEYSDVDRKGRRHQTIAGSKPENRIWLSTNSNRRERIKAEYFEKYGKGISQKELDLAMQVTKGAKTQAAKQADHGSLEQYELWRQAMETAGLTLDMPGRGVPVTYPIEDAIEELHRRLESESGLNRLCNDDSSFAHDQVLPAVMRAGIGLGLTPEALRTLAEEYIETKLVCTRWAEEPSARYYTTTQILENQTCIGKGLDHLATHASPAVAPEIVRAVIGRQDQAPDQGQAKMIRAVCGPRRLVHVQALAGSGKTRAVSIAIEALRESGLYDQIVGVAVAAKCGGELCSKLGADRGGSVESMYRQWQAGWRATERTAIVVDEIALANIFDMKHVLEIAGAVFVGDRMVRGPKAKLIMLGDLKQNVAIGPSGWLGEEISKRPALELDRVYRQKHEADRIMLDHLRAGRSEIAVQMLHDRNRIMVVDEQRDMLSLLADRYDTYRHAGYGPDEIAVVFQGSNQELDDYNMAIRRVRIARGEVDLSESYVVDETTTGRRFTICKGARIVFNKAQFDGLREPIRNGTTGEVLGVRNDGSVRLRLNTDDRRMVTVRLKPEMDVAPFSEADVMSTSRYQGSQARVTLVIPGTPEISSLNSAYSQNSRFTDQLEVLVNREQWSDGYRTTLATAWAKPVVKRMAGPVERVRGQQDESWSARTDPDFEQELRTDIEIVDGSPVVVLAEEEISEPTVDEVAQQYINDLRRRMEYGQHYGEDLGL